jgi:heme/copper-type cytochrome/quinol oxidase subunit 2
VRNSLYLTGQLNRSIFDLKLNFETNSEAFNVMKNINNFDRNKYDFFTYDKDFFNYDEDFFNYDLAIKSNLKHSIEFNTNLAERLLRTKRVLVLPVNTHISIITNSYDVVHSWFLPDQGIKFDCVPGRSTHHDFYLDTFGDVRGQCAEVCGRFHHHMPIYLVGVRFGDFFM